MSWFNLIAAGSLALTQDLRAPVRRADNPGGDAAGAAGAFDATLAAACGKRSDPVAAANSNPKKVDQPAAKTARSPSNGQGTDDQSGDGSAEPSASPAPAPCAPAASAAAASAKNASSAAPVGAKPADAGASPAPSPDGTVLLVAMSGTCAAPVLGDASVKDGPTAPLDAGTKTALPPALGKPPAPPQSPSPAAPAAAQATPAPAKPAPAPAASADAAEPLPAPPPAVTDQPGPQTHEKPHAAHAPVTESDGSSDSPKTTPVQPNPAVPVQDSAVAGDDTAAATVEPNNSSDKPAPTAPATTVPTLPLAAGPIHLVDGPASEAKPAPAAQNSPHAAASDPTDQVVMGLQGKLDARTGKAEIRLDPPNLGVVKVSVTLDNGTLTAEFQSASNVVRDLLKGNLEKLKTALEGQGVAVDRLAVNAPPAAPDTGTPGQNSQASFGSATHDGRSAGQHQPDPRSGQQRSAGGGFARLFTQAQEAPLDLVA